MEILIINFNLKDLTQEEYEQLCEPLAPAFAEVPGLQSKVWLADPATNTYGGVYTFASAADLDAFLASELFAGIGAHPSIADATVRRFGVLEAPTRVTHGLVPVGS